ncbi:DNA methyltransferase [Laspinema olomoucense]|uniref:DNA methyltransferase n=1 Tax=Laspinema olomoucense TaxID=3231600 RepID=UPI0021BAC1D3|nr:MULTISPECIES: DNA methyltransferase [unclassified Laspinema]MCT7972645.1 site-specific DNA-methyltransferase [Laspinema sp. D3d]MCT7990167.1 site-specific DNA-methyltransferase [Laspinema sp. D3a]
MKVLKGDCLKLLEQIQDESVEAIYLDPPFFTEKTHKLKNRDGSQEFSFDDLWGCHKKYAEFLYQRLVHLHRVLKSSGSIFIHCDATANYLIRSLLNEVFGPDQFRSEIIWYYKRWSNSKKGLLPAHQTIYFYSKTDSFTFNTRYTDYSESTNVDQILQRRSRDSQGKTVYARDEQGEVILNDSKKGVPLSDVWDIPYLNPKAKERVGYPTQKPILLLERIIEIATNPGDLILDPFCGSGTTLVAAKLLGRHGIGMDISADAVELTQKRLVNPLKTDSHLLKKGRKSYLTADAEALALLQGLDVIPVHRNKGIDAILKQQFQDKPVLVRVQKSGESLLDAVLLLSKAAQTKGSQCSILVRTQPKESVPKEVVPSSIQIIDSPALQVASILHDFASTAIVDKK